jgi:SAM-dependent methyltransferase
MDAMEVSGDSYSRWFPIPFKSFTRTSYPEFDICTDKIDATFDIIIADQVFEHLLWPYRAAKNIYGMLRPNGYFLILTPFLVRRHDAPVDCSRWTEKGLAYFLAEAGFALDQTVTGSWGNAACVRAHLHKRELWLSAAWPWLRSLRNEPAFPVTVWALAQK